MHKCIPACRDIHRKMIVMKLSHKHSWASVPPAQSLRVCSLQSVCVCVVSTWKRGCGVMCRHGRLASVASGDACTDFPFFASSHHSSLTAFKATPPPDEQGRWCRLIELDKEAALRKSTSRGSWKKTSELGGDLYVVAVLTFHRCTSGSITPAGKGERKGEAFHLQSVEWLLKRGHSDCLCGRYSRLL